MNRKKILILLLTMLVISNLVNAADAVLNYTQSSQDAVSARGGETPQFKINQIRQDPAPANPGEYTDVYLKLDNLGGSIENPSFNLILPYPFLLDPYSDTSTRRASLAGGERLSLRYRLRVDKNALPGDYEIEFRAYAGQTTFYPYFFNIQVDDVTSSFDVALQDVTKDGASIAISNIGKNAANAITVSLENQTDFELLGVSTSILGNLNAGDYTLINTFIKPMQADHLEKKLRVQIEYTDKIGNRRSVKKELPVMMTTKIAQGFSELETNVLQSGKTQQMKSNSTTYFVIALIIVMAIAFFYNRRKKRKKNEME
ncbi:hypothetical protein HZB00_03420 [Candidatus Woesearchaeota archaeon]|nr:hypothetical protein [Candidatus Woesearchaeota archaeon]